VSAFAKASELILDILASHRKLSQKGIATYGKIPARTVRYNLKQLVQKGLVRESIVWNDLRQKEFELGDGLCLIRY